MLRSSTFPRAPIHLAEPVATLPGAGTVSFKRDVVAPLVQRFDIVAAFGNRASDIDAYGEAGVAADRIFLKLPEFKGEVQAALDRHDAIGFSGYADLPAF